jgi:hypothetical protein
MCVCVCVRACGFGISGLGNDIRMADYDFFVPYQFYGNHSLVCSYIISSNFITLLCFNAIYNIGVTIRHNSTPAKPTSRPP